MSTPAITADPWSQYAVKKPAANDPWAQYASPVTRAPKPAPTTQANLDKGVPQPSFLQTLIQPTEKTDAEYKGYTGPAGVAGATIHGLSNFAEGTLGAVKGLYKPFTEPETAEEKTKREKMYAEGNLSSAAPPDPLSRGLGRMATGVEEGAQRISQNPAGVRELKKEPAPFSTYLDLAQPTIAAAGGQALTGIALLKLPEAVAGAGKIAGKIRNIAIGDPNVPALRGLGVSAGSKQSLRTLSNVETARPYLQGVKSEAELQGRIPQAKAEIWEPYKKVIDSPVGDKIVQGPDGAVTIRDLEAARLKSAADLRATRQMQPADQAALERKQGTIAELMERDRAIKAVLDPELEKAGLNPQTIRKVHGSVQGIEKLVSGKSTLAEPEHTYGLGHVKDVSLTKPATWFSPFGNAARDVAAGRPWWSGRPTDVNISEAFRNAPAKPILTRPLGQAPAPAQTGLEFERPINPIPPPPEPPLSRNVTERRGEERNFQIRRPKAQSEKPR